jgi:C4-dicarboxylate-specific signal transduction histidine kinase
MLEGPKWALFLGLVVSFGSLFIGMILFLSGLLENFDIIFILIMSGFPLSLVAYVALWFRHSLKNIVSLTHEKQAILEDQNEQLENLIQERTRELNESLDNLKSTQDQLIHSEKMASLGELTAGIAHEIQNPLNFVNNFSELNNELLEELQDAVATNDQEEVEAIIKDLTENSGKITHHGKRA